MDRRGDAVTEYEITTHPDGKQFIRIEDKWMPMDDVVEAWHHRPLEMSDPIVADALEQIQRVKDRLKTRLDANPNIG